MAEYDGIPDDEIWNIDYSVKIKKNSIQYFFLKKHFKT